MSTMALSQSWAGWPCHMGRSAQTHTLDGLDTYVGWTCCMSRLTSLHDCAGWPCHISMMAVIWLRWPCHMCRTAQSKMVLSHKQDGPVTRARRSFHMSKMALSQEHYGTIISHIRWPFHMSRMALSHMRNAQHVHDGSVTLPRWPCHMCKMAMAHK